METVIDKLTEVWDIITQKSQIVWERILILAHGDLDGIVSAIMMQNIFKKYSEETEVVFTLPHWIYKHNHCDPYDLIICVDLAVNNRDTSMTKRFIEKYKNKLLWIDHHDNPVDFNDIIISNSSYKSCVSFLKELFPNIKFSEIVEELIKLAHESDQGRGDNTYQKALKVNQRNDETRYEIYRLGITHPQGELYNKSLDRLKRKEEYYENVIYPNTLNLLKKRKKHGAVSIVDMRYNRDKTIDNTLLAFKCYEDTPFFVRRFFASDPKESEKTPDEYIMISTKPGVRVDLLKLFHLKSGADFRITVKNTFKEKELVDKLTTAYHQSLQ